MMLAVDGLGALQDPVDRRPADGQQFGEVGDGVLAAAVRPAFVPGGPA